MRRPGVGFWRVVFAASVILFVAGAAVTVLTIVSGGVVHTSWTSSIPYGDGALGFVSFPTLSKRDSFAREWTYKATDPDRSLLDSEYMVHPVVSTRTGVSGFVFPSYYIPALAMITGVPSAVMLRRHKKKIAAGLCAGCGYSLAGLPVDAAACPECGVKIGKSAAEAR